jgi:pyridinium-3,5-bisthiocarboxylic acid mononucleotide nickel chelatase
MSRSAHLDCIGGIAGDMLLGALLDAGGDVEVLRRLLPQLGLEHAEITVQHVSRQGIAALHVETKGEGSTGGSWREIRALIEAAELHPSVSAMALKTFSRLAEAEGRVHGVAAEEVHFHEVGSLDAIVEICGAAVLLKELGIERLTCSPLPMTRGLTKAAHGVLPLPAPATIELLRGAPLVEVEGDMELVTPTGAALAATCADSWGRLPHLVLDEVGYGAGSRDPCERPNVLRLLVGSVDPGAASAEVCLLETNLDDLSPELVPDAVEGCFAAGALDVWTVPAQMKKGRPGLVLSALARPRDEAAVATAILEQTTTLGVRAARLSRYELERQDRVVAVQGGSVRVKIGLLGGRVVNVAPEHDDCAMLAARTGRSVKAVFAEAVAAGDCA